MSIGSGWYPEEPKDEAKELTEKLLKDTLATLFDICQKRHDESFAIRESQTANDIKD